MDTPPIPVVTIDGPTASGKGTIACRVAVDLGFHLLDSGALYRLTALASFEAGVAVEEIDALVKIAESLDIVFTEGVTLLGGRDVSDDIRGEAIGLRASTIAVHGKIREALVARQQAFRAPAGIWGRSFFPTHS
jgi:cytidylate kinase